MTVCNKTLSKRVASFYLKRPCNWNEYTATAKLQLYDLYILQGEDIAL